MTERGAAMPAHCRPDHDVDVPDVGVPFILFTGTSESLWEALKREVLREGRFAEEPKPDL